jgi:hypothetical protein
MDERLPSGAGSDVKSAETDSLNESKMPSASIMPGVNKPGLVPREWDLERDILSTRTIPQLSVLRPSKGSHKGTGTCSCKGDESHRSFFDLCQRVIAPHLAMGGEEFPEIKVCWNAENLFESVLERSLSFDGVRRKFIDSPTVGHAKCLLHRGTYWFDRIIKQDPETKVYGRTGVAVLRLLAGLKSYSGKEHIGQLCAKRLKKSSVHKLRNILATIDGLLMQLVLSFPEKREFLTWERIDQVSACLLSLLVADYFRDCNEKVDLSRLSTFEKVKRLRKAIKMEGFNPSGDLNNVEVPREISFLQVALKFVGNGKRPIDLYRVSILCQTRASGVPPRSVYFKTLAKIKEVLLDPPDPSVYEGLKGLIQAGVDRVHEEALLQIGGEQARENFWRNCLDKAKISLSDSGEFFTKSSDGGKLEAARKVLSSGNLIDKYNLHNGEVVGTLDPAKDSAGECLFHWALGQFSDDEKCYERNLMSVRISLVAELGKYRSITVSHLAHAVLLHVLSHVLLEYLRVIPSSESGVKAANHAWNFFKRISHKNPCADFIFRDKDEIVLFSTDWEQATDYCDHAVSEALLNRLCTNLGIPDWYRETVVFALCAPRQVEFIDPENKTLEMFLTTRGELMGDPVVKVILHFYHLVGRKAAELQIQEIISSKRFDENLNMLP